MPGIHQRGQESTNSGPARSIRAISAPRFGAELSSQAFPFDMDVCVIRRLRYSSFDMDVGVIRQSSSDHRKTSRILVGFLPET